MDKNFSWDEDNWFDDAPVDNFLEPEAEVVDDFLPASEEEEVQTSTPEETTQEAEETVEEPVVETVVETTEETSEETDSKYKAVLEGLKAQGILGEDVEDVDSFLENVEETVLSSIEKGVDESISSLVRDVGEDGASFLQFKRQGGSTEAFFKTYTDYNLGMFDLNSDAGQSQFARWYMTKIEGKEKEEVDDLVEYLEVNEKLESFSTRSFAKVQAKEKEKRTALLKQQEEAYNQQKAAEKQRKEELRTKLRNVNEYAGFTISPTDKRTIFEYLTNPTEAIGDKFVPKFVAEISRYQKEAPEKLAVIVKLMQSDFDLSEITKGSEKKVAKKIKSALQNESKPKQKTLPPTSKNVWDYFN